MRRAARSVAVGAIRVLAGAWGTVAVPVCCVNAVDLVESRIDAQSALFAVTLASLTAGHVLLVRRVLRWPSRLFAGIWAAIGAAVSAYSIWVVIDRGPAEFYIFVAISYGTAAAALAAYALCPTDSTRCADAQDRSDDARGSK